jgi:hypothetical protein
VILFATIAGKCNRDHCLRRLLVQRARHILGPFGADSDLRQRSA